jgi:signal transduction histidine kinase
MSEDKSQTRLAPSKAEHADDIRSERTQTDESLRVERAATDQVLEEELAAIDETADAVVGRARERADEVLAAARAKSDRHPAPQAPLRPAPENLSRDRVREDQIIQDERANADEILREERAGHVALLSREREATDQDLSHERARSDAAHATRDEYMGIVSHDLRNLLNAMVGSAELIVQAVSRENHVDQVRTSAQRIQRSATRMNRLIGDLVDVASIEAGRLAVTREVADATQVVTEAVEIFQAQAAAGGIALSAEATLPPCDVAFDAARILQVLTNLLSNALKFTPANGTVVVGVERLGDDLGFSVRDTGVGVPPEQLETVFQRFVQLTRNDRRGVGLGLYISKAIVEGHGGRIWAENAVGGGTTFRFTLPIASAS